MKEVRSISPMRISLRMMAILVTSTVAITAVLYSYARISLLVSDNVIQDQSASASLTILRGKSFG